MADSEPVKSAPVTDEEVLRKQEADKWDEKLSLHFSHVIFNACKRHYNETMEGDELKTPLDYAKPRVDPEVIETLRAAFCGRGFRLLYSLYENEVDQVVVGPNFDVLTLLFHPPLDMEKKLLENEDKKRLLKGFSKPMKGRNILCSYLRYQFEGLLRNMRNNDDYTYKLLSCGTTEIGEYPKVLNSESQLNQFVTAKICVSLNSIIFPVEAAAANWGVVMSDTLTRRTLRVLKNLPADLFLSERRALLEEQERKRMDMGNQFAPYEGAYNVTYEEEANVKEAFTGRVPNHHTSHMLGRRSFAPSTRSTSRASSEASSGYYSKPRSTVERVVPKVCILEERRPGWRDDLRRPISPVYTGRSRFETDASFNKRKTPDSERPGYEHTLRTNGSRSSKRRFSSSSEGESEDERASKATSDFNLANNDRGEKQKTPEAVTREKVSDEEPSAERQEILEDFGVVSETEEAEEPVEFGEISKDVEEVELVMEIKLPEEQIVTESTPEEANKEDDKMEEIEDIALFIAGQSGSSKETTKNNIDTTQTTSGNSGGGLGQTRNGQPIVPGKAELKSSESSNRKVCVLSLCKYMLKYGTLGLEAAEAVMSLACLMGNEKTLLQLSEFRDAPEELMVKAAKLESLLTTNPEILEAADM